MVHCFEWGTLTVAGEQIDAAAMVAFKHGARGHPAFPSPAVIQQLVKLLSPTQLARALENGNKPFAKDMDSLGVYLAAVNKLAEPPRYRYTFVSKEAGPHPPEVTLMASTVFDAWSTLARTVSSSVEVTKKLWRHDKTTLPEGAL